LDAGMVELDAGMVELDAGMVELDAGMVELDAGMVELDAGLAYTPANVDTIISEKIIIFIDNSTKPSVLLPFLNRFLIIQLIDSVNR
jgi:hypothetical protein